MTSAASGAFAVPPASPASPARGIHAAPLTGRGWLGTGGRELSLAGLRGKFVLLDFWTFCCMNCLHVLDELRELEQTYRDVLVIIGVHSPKFVHEADPVALRDAVERYHITHPVLDDPTLGTWNAYAARAWPTLTLIDPEGYVVAQMSGEGHAHGLEVLLRDLVARHEAAGTLHRGDGPFVPPPPAETALRFPGKIVAAPDGGFLVSDTAHHQIVEFDGDLVTERRRFGSGRRGRDDGAPGAATFCEPQGMVALPAAVAARVGYDVVIADTVNHALRGVRLSDGVVSTVAGTGAQLRERSGAGPALQQELSSPWDVAWWGDAVVVAMAGTHQLWRFDPVAGTVSAWAGTSAEGLRDGAVGEAHFAQPSGLAVSGDGQTLWVADSETSALRSVSRDQAATSAADHKVQADGSLPGEARGRDHSDGGAWVATAVGVGLFDFGHVDGAAGQARMQHPLGVAVLPDGSVAVADTYNGAVRRFDPVSGEMSTLATDLAEPSDVAVVTGADDDPVLVVVESAAHRLTRVTIPSSARRVRGEAQHTQRAATAVSDTGLSLQVDFVPPAGQKLDDRFGDPTRLEVAATPRELLAEGGGAGEGLTRELRFSPGVTEGVLHISVQAAACDGDPVTGTVPEFAACHLYQQDWGIPVTLGADGDPDLLLPLRAT